VESGRFVLALGRRNALFPLDYNSLHVAYSVAPLAIGNWQGFNQPGTSFEIFIMVVLQTTGATTRNLVLSCLGGFSKREIAPSRKQSGNHLMARR
jgi:hypothetical protein